MAKEVFKKSRGLVRLSVFGAAAVIFCFFSFLFTSPIYAQPDPVKELDKTAGREGAGFKTGLTPEQFIGGLVQGVFAMLGVIFLVLIVYGGVLWVVSEGDPKKTGKARGLIYHSIVGLILVFAAYGITYFVVKVVINATLEP